MIDYRMSGKQLDAALDRVGISQRGAGRRLGLASERTVRRMVAGDADVPIPVMIALALMIHHGHAADDVEAIVRATFPPARRKAVQRAAGKPGR